jgi:hypothetical protein
VVTSTCRFPSVPKQFIIVCAAVSLLIGQLLPTVDIHINDSNSSGEFLLEPSIQHLVGFPIHSPYPTAVFCLSKLPRGWVRQIGVSGGLKMARSCKFTSLLCDLGCTGFLEMGLYFSGSSSSNSIIWQPCKSAQHGMKGKNLSLLA